MHKQRIGRRKEEDGKVTWISQTDWEDEQRNAEGSESRRLFAFRLDDSEKKGKIIITSPTLVNVVRHIIPQRLFESVADGIAIEEPYAQLFHFVDDMRKHMISHKAENEDMEDIDALEVFLYECQPQYKSARDASNSGLPALISFDTLWALFKAGDLVVITDKFEEKRVFKFTHLEEKLNPYSGRREVCVKLSVCGWCINWDREQRCFTQKSYGFNIERFMGHRSVRSLPVYPLRCEEDETRKSLLASLESRGRTWAQLASTTPCYFEYDGRALITQDYSRIRSEGDIQVS